MNIVKQVFNLKYEVSMKFRPLHDRIVVKPLPAETKTASGIIIPDSAQEKPLEGEVLAVGSGSRNSNGDIIPMEVKAGDKVLYGKWGGTEVTIENDKVIIIKESDIMGIL